MSARTKMGVGNEEGIVVEGKRLTANEKRCEKLHAGPRPSVRKSRIRANHAGVKRRSVHRNGVPDVRFESSESVSVSF